MTVLTAAVVKDQVLNRAMDARALNLEQERLLFNPTREIDSVLELAQTLVSRDVGTAARLSCLTRRLMESNRAEGDRERDMALFADQLATDLRRHELNGPRPLLLVSAKSLARQVRDDLAVILDPAGHDALRFVTAVRRVDDIIARVPRAQLLAREVAHQLGAARFELLEELISSYNDCRAQEAVPGPASHPEGTGNDRAEF